MVPNLTIRVASRGESGSPPTEMIPRLALVFVVLLGSLHKLLSGVDIGT